MIILGKSLLLIFFIFIASCSSSNLKKSLGFEKDVPDEFLVQKGNPIKKPPNYDILPPDSLQKNKNKQSNKNNNNTETILNDELNASIETNSNTISGKSSEIEKNFLDEIQK